MAAYAPQVKPPGSGSALSRALDAAEDASPVDAVEAVTHELGLSLGATTVSFLIADLSGRALVRLDHGLVATGGFATTIARVTTAGARPSPRWCCPSTAARPSRRCASQTVRVVAPDRDSTVEGASAGQWRVLAPVTERGEVLGLLEMSLPDEPDAGDAGGDRPHGAPARLRRDREPSAHRPVRVGSAQHPVHPARRDPAAAAAGGVHLRGGSFTLSAWLEPAANVGGDTFDYSLGRDVLHLSMTDAMGHGVASALTATLCVGSLRNTRRQGATLLEQAARGEHGAGRARHEHRRRGLRHRAARAPRPPHRGPHARQRRARRRPTSPAAAGRARSSCRRGVPLGPVRRCGVRQHRAASSNPATGSSSSPTGCSNATPPPWTWSAEIKQTRTMHPRETTRRLADNVLEVTGPNLADDATLLVLDWHGEHGRDRDTVAGADIERTDPTRVSRGAGCPRRSRSPAAQLVVHALSDRGLGLDPADREPRGIEDVDVVDRPATDPESAHSGHAEDLPAVELHGRADEFLPVQPRPDVGCLAGLESSAHGGHVRRCRRCGLPPAATSLGWPTRVTPVEDGSVTLRICRCCRVTPYGATSWSTCSG